MENTKPTTPDSFADMFFPGKGINDSVSMNEVPPGFTSLGENVFLFEALTGRARGGSRFGISKLIGDQHSGDHEIQHLNYIVTVSASMIGWAFDGADQGFPGVYGGIGFLEQIDGGTPGAPGFGGGGYQPFPNMPSRILTMGARNLVTGAIVMSVGTRRTVEWPAGTAPIRIRCYDQDGRTGEYKAFETIGFHTTPSGNVGDGETAATQFALDDPPVGVHGLAEISVNSMIPGYIDYYATHDGFVVPPLHFVSRVPIRVRYTPYKLTEDANHDSANVNAPVIIKGTLEDPLGNPVSGRTVKLHTTGGTGNDLTAVTDDNGQVKFNVTNSSPGAVTYSMTEISESVNNIENRTVNYTATITAVQTATVRAFQSDPAVVAFPGNVTTGNLIVVTLAMTSLPNPLGTATPIVVTDSLGNTYFEAASVEYDYAMDIYDPTLLNMAKLFYCVSVATGACTVTATMNGGVVSDFGWIVSMVNVEYAGVKTISPLFSTSTWSGGGQTANTGSISIGTTGDLVVAFFGMGISGGYPAAPALPEFDTFTVAQTTGGFANRASQTIGFSGNSYVADIVSGTAGAVAANWTMTPQKYYGNGVTPVVVGWVAIGVSFQKA